ncbi:zinc finger protein 1-like [Eurosta solidaginis]|uniref:zinc finger protein 1-like n=1 Tax=Eurosta solidaginis TaxID=178769 RepID=UPI00353153EE
MLSCLVPSLSRFGQEDNIINQSMPSSPAFAVQFPSLASSLHHPHHKNSSKNNSNSEEEPTSMTGAISPHTDFMVKCPQCSMRLGFQSLREHIANEHPHEKLNIDYFPSSLGYNHHNL